MFSEVAANINALWHDETSMVQHVHSFSRCMYRSDNCVCFGDADTNVLTNTKVHARLSSQGV